MVQMIRAIQATMISFKVLTNTVLILHSVPPTLNKFSVGSELRLGQRVSMLCSITDGDLPMSLTWFRDDVRLVHTSSLNGVTITEIGRYESVLRIDELRPEHNANFTCVAENVAGRAAHSQMLRVKGVWLRHST